MYLSALGPPSKVGIDLELLIEKTSCVVAAFKFYLIKFVTLTIVLWSRAYLSFALLGFHWSCLTAISLAPNNISLPEKIERLPLYMLSLVLTRDSNYKNHWVLVISHMYDSQEGILRTQIAALNLVLKSSNMRQIQKSTFSVKSARILFLFWNVYKIFY